ncbi:MAG TPA: ATP-binding protein [Vicinamibacterales bacterium]|jgi:signal transduction histidine kinase/DNA-binding response OmpR family regulator|nr:ATP-binding protein [Vicinamibacterales bacterium]
MHKQSIDAAASQSNDDGKIEALIRATDWTRSPLGHPSAWSHSLRSAVRIMVTSRFAMWMGWGPDLTFLYNDAYAAMTLGAKHPWAFGRPAREVWAEIWPQIGPRIDKVLRTGEATWDESLLLFLERSGFPEETYHTFSYSPIPDDSGATGGMLCVVTEETERVIGERRLTLLHDLTANLSATTTTAEALAAVGKTLEENARDLPFTLVYLFEDGEKRANLSALSGMSSTHPGAPLHLDDESEWRRAMDAARSMPTLVTLADDLAWPSGPWERSPRHAMVVPIAKPGQSQPAGLFVAGLNPFRPVDDGYRNFIALLVGQVASGLANVSAYEAERRRSEALAELDRAKTVFFSNVSHELRTPLTLMLAPIEDLLSDPSIGDQHRSHLGLLQRNGLRLRKLVNTLLEFSRIESGRVDARYQPTDLGTYTGEIASVFRSAAQRAGLSYRVDIAANTEPVYVDREMWEKVVLNLISNAYKFTLDGEIAVHFETTGGRAVLTVSDTGCGIPSHELAHVSDRFHRIDGSRGRTHEGTGIGLALVQELVKLHGGSMEVASEIDRGSTFTVSIPLGSRHLPPDRLDLRGRDVSMVSGAEAFVEEALRWLPDGAGDQPSSAAADMATSPSEHDESIRILLADDNADMRDYITRLLGHRWTVEAVGNGRAALAAAAARRPDLVITDVMMPHLDGFGVLKELKADERLREIPVLMLSARAGEESRFEGLQAGADDYLIKPFSARELLSRVESQLLRARIRRVEELHHRRLMTIFTHAPVGICVFRGPEHIYEFANPPYLALVSNRAILGKTVREALPEAGADLYDMLDGVYRTGRPHIGRSLRLVLNRGVDGMPEEAFFDFVYQPLFDDAERVEGIVVVVFEVTDLANARREAEAASRAKDEFLAMLGHELRNPLAPILTALQLMRLRGVDANERERTIIERQAKQLVTLVDDLLDISRITRGKIQLKTASIELADVVVKAVEMASPVLERYGHHLDIDVPRGGLTLEGDASRLAQVVSNLLTNAAKYTEAGGLIAVTGRAADRTVILRVRDSGIGIEPEMLPRIFDLFTQEHQAIDRAQGGLGLGLAIVKSLVIAHGGTVAAFSEGKGRGSEFVVTLPLLEGIPSATTRDADAASSALPGRSRRVLIVDDNDDGAHMLADALAALGHTTRVVNDPLQALAEAERIRPDVAVLDLGLPVMDGYELARRFKDHAQLRDVSLVAVTGYGQDRDRRQTEAAGFDAHLTKPVDIQELGTLVNSLSVDESHQR